MQPLQEKYWSFKELHRYNIIFTRVCLIWDLSNSRREYRFAELASEKKFATIFARPGPIDRDELAQERLKERVMEAFSFVLPRFSHTSQIAASLIQAAETALSSTSASLGGGAGMTLT